MKRVWTLLPLAVALAACGDDGAGTSVSIKGDDGNTLASVGKDGRVEIKAPGFEGSVKLPKFAFGADDFEVDGLKLYPGSTIANLNVDSSGGNDGSVKVDFDAPAAADQVQSWFREQMQSAGFTVDLKNGALAGKTGDGSPFSLKVTPQGDGKSRGSLTVTGN
ncbi:hypothetical protein [Sphingomonas turrisvirgatae]|uniref:Lipoprotein n=1 Tax=Sphingomonas turrisvirgatae TaxID=1888892 RepID=A0A1E3M3L3_9SPHN|nr:hypothetical protein [Sphingomonas turrisvirgatae]ODP39660.1 hypothetical protein BFL28_08470 [Sphingomonas turrisvirgatae]